LLPFLLLLTFTVPCLSGCGYRKDIQRLYLVLAVGVDITPDDKFEVTMQILNPGASSTQTGGGGGASPGTETLILTGIGDSFFDALYDSSKSISRTHHFGHTKYIVIGDALARKGIGQLIDSLTKISEIRLNTPLLVTRGRAMDIVKAQTPKAPIPAIVVEDLFFRHQFTGFRPFTYLLDFISALDSDSTSPVAGVIEVAKETNVRDKIDETFVMGGTAVFKKDKLIGYLNTKETRGMMWVRGKVEVGSVTFSSDKFGKVTLELLNSKSKIKPVIRNNSITIDINIINSSAVRRTGKSVDTVKNPEILDEIGMFEDRAIKEEIQMSLQTVKENFGVDIFGFGEIIHERNPKLWKSISKDWETAFQSMEVDINVDSRVRGTGLTLKSID
jgi:spore germination protein KC